MRVKMLKDFGKYQEGTVQDVTVKEAMILVKRGTAELVKKPKPTETREEE